MISNFLLGENQRAIKEQLKAEPRIARIYTVNDHYKNGNEEKYGLLT